MSPRPRRLCGLCGDARTHDPPLWIRRRDPRPVCEACHGAYHDVVPDARREGKSPLELLRLRRRYFAYEIFPTDRLAATFLGITRTGFARWREKHGLPAIPRVRRDARPRELAAFHTVDHADRWFAWETGLNDHQASRLFDEQFSQEAMASWRYRMGLPSNDDGGTYARRCVADALGVDPEAIPC